MSDVSGRRGQGSLGSVGSARDDARGRGDIVAPWMPHLPPSSSPRPPAGVAPSELLWAERVAPGGYTQLRVARGTVIRFDDPDGDACAHIALFNAIQPHERLNVADTQKIPWQAYLGEGHPLLSGDGRVLATIVSDDSGRHDAFAGTSSDAWNRSKYGDSSPEGGSPSGHGLLLKAAVKLGLGARDIPPTVSFFQGVRIDDDGTLRWLGSAGPGCSVELLAELPLLVLVANVPHPVDPRGDYIVGALDVHAWRSSPSDPDDGRVAATPERVRAYRNTVAFADLVGC